MNPSSHKAFTLIELLVVISIISLLASVVLASLDTARSKARDARRLMDMRTVATAINAYFNDNGSYPNTGSMSNVYVDPGCSQTSLSGGDQKTANWVPGLVPTYISALPMDPKPVDGGGCYMYSGDGAHFLLSAYGTVEASSNGGRMDSDFGYREIGFWMDAPSCYYSTNYPSIDVVHRKSFTITSLTTDDFGVCPKIGP